MESQTIELSQDEMNQLDGLAVSSPEQRWTEASALLSKIVKSPLRERVSGLGPVSCGPTARTLLARGSSVDLGTDNRRCDITYLFVEALFAELVRAPRAGSFSERSGDFLRWIVDQGCPAEVACDAISGMEARWAGEGEAIWVPLALADPERLVPLGRTLSELSLARASHQFGRMIDIIDNMSTKGPAEARLEGYRWFARLGGGSEPLSRRTVDRVMALLDQPLFRSNCNARFVVINGLFLAPPTDQLSSEETGEAIERSLTGFLLTAFYGQHWIPFGAHEPIRNPTDVRNLWGGNSAVIGYFYARAFRLLGDFDRAMDCVDYAFMGLGSDGFAQTLMNQLERERESIRLSREFTELADGARDARNRVERAVDGLRSENAQLIATFTGFFAFVFGALALFFGEQETLSAGRSAGEIVLVNLAVLAPAGLVLAALIVLARWVFSPRETGSETKRLRNRR